MLVSSGKMSTFATAKAAIAQLVEHDLAKVGVASSSLVCRSQHAQVAELVDAHVSGACAARRAGSSPVLGTKHKKPKRLFDFLNVGEMAELVDALL